MSRRNASRQSAKAGFAAALLLLVTGYAAAAPVSPPTSLTATALSSSQIRLNWADTNNNETGYFVERSLSSGSGFAQIASLAANVATFTNTGLAAGTTYYYRVRSSGTQGKNVTYSSYSNVVSARTTSVAPTPTPPPSGVPAAPSNAASASPSSTQITISWTDNSSNETGFKVERAMASGGPWTYIGSTALTGYGDNGRAAGTTYFYRVQAYNASGNSAYSNTTSATTQGGTGVPAAPGSASATTVSSSQINVGWADTSGNETGFKIERSTAAAPWAQVATVGANVTSYSSTGLAASTTYSFRVRAYNASGDSGYSNTASAATSAGGTGGGGTHLWSTDSGGPTAGVDSAKPVGMVVDSTGASVVLGSLNGSVNFGGGSLTSAGNGDIYLVKYSASGGHVWSKRFGGTGDDVPRGIAIDSSGNVVITGFFVGSVDFGGGALPGVSGNGFLVKYSSAGTHVWSKRLTTGSTIDEGTAVGVDGSGNVIVAAGFYNTVSFGGSSMTSAGSEDIGLIKYSSAGAHLWSKRMGGAGMEMVRSVAVDQTTGEFVTAGYFAGSVNFGGVALTSAGLNDAFVARYNSAGTHTWSRRWGSTNEDKAFGVDVDGLGNVVATGMFTNSVDFGGGPLTNAGGVGSGDIFLVRISSAGVHLWSKGFGSSLVVNQFGYGVAFDGAGNVLLTGAMVALTAPYTVDFGGGPLAGDGYSNTFIAKFGSNGAHTWSKRYLAGNGHAAGIGIAADGSGNALTSGTYDNSINFGGTTLTSPGGTDGFIVKLGP